MGINAFSVLLLICFIDYAGEIKCELHKLMKSNWWVPWRVYSWMLTTSCKHRTQISWISVSPVLYDQCNQCLQVKLKVLDLIVPLNVMYRMFFSTASYINFCILKEELHFIPKLSMFVLYLEIITTFLKENNNHLEANCLRIQKWY